LNPHSSPLSLAEMEGRSPARKTSFEYLGVGQPSAVDRKDFRRCFHCRDALSQCNELLGPDPGAARHFENTLHGLDGPHDCPYLAHLAEPLCDFCRPAIVPALAVPPFIVLPRASAVIIQMLLENVRLARFIHLRAAFRNSSRGKASAASRSPQPRL